MQSPLSGFCEVLKEVKRRAREYPPRNETQTRMALIDPVLTALGWDLSNPHQVELESRRRADRTGPGIAGAHRADQGAGGTVHYAVTGVDCRDGDAEFQGGRTLAVDGVFVGARRAVPLRTVPQHGGYDGK